jgi:hypothetical protein
LPLIVVLAYTSGVARAQSVSLEYQVKAAYLFNFVKFVGWPAAAPGGPITICIAGQNPFGTALEETIRGETVDGRSIATRTVPEADSGCHVVFVPRGANAAASLRAARALPVLTVGEASDFIENGGIINFVTDAGAVRFQIDQDAASRVGLQISSRLLRLARLPDRHGPTR